MTYLRALSLLFLIPIAAIAAPIDDAALRMPRDGDTSLHVLSPTLLEFTFVAEVAKGAKPLPPEQGIHRCDIAVTVGGERREFARLGFKRRALYAPLTHHDLRVSTSIYIELAEPLDPAHPSEVKLALRPNKLFPRELSATATMAPDRYSPAIHVNQEGYTPEGVKLGMVGYYLGTMGEMPVPAEAEFDVVNASPGKSAFHGKLRSRRDIGFTLSPKPYQSVYEIDFSDLREPGEYRIRVGGLGESLPFRIDAGEFENAARAYALGLFHQRCGTPLQLPFTRFTHDACHTGAAEVPMPARDFEATWEIIRKLDEDDVKPEHPEQQLKRPEQQYYPFQRGGAIDVSGGHHDAGDYSKYTTNSADFIHALMFAVDSFPGVAELDNLGIPESGDGISDVMQEAKWEADFLAKMQDDDGGFYFLVYPKERRYEVNVLPDHGDAQVVWPKTTSATAAAVAALAQCGSSPTFKKQYPEVAAAYLAKAKKGWDFLLRALAEHGRSGAYQRLTHYGDAFQDVDELAWAAAELFAATGDTGIENKLFEWFPNPSDPKTQQYQWRRASFCFGNAMRAYAFAASSGRLPRSKLNPSYLAKCETELKKAGDDATHWCEQNAYGVSFPEPSKRYNAAGWFFASDSTFDITVAYQLEKRPAYADAVIANLNYELGCNPLNRVFLTGLGIRRQREIVDQYAQNDGRVLPPTGIPLGCLESNFSYLGTYGNELKDESVPHDDGGGTTYPLYDRWSDTFNLSTEFVGVNQARSLASLAFWAAQTPLKTQRWKSANARIKAPSATIPLGRPTTFSLQCEDLDLSSARVVWEAQGQEPAFGQSFTIKPTRSGTQWVEAEASLSDGRRVFARATFNANAPVVLWVNGALPDGATGGAQGGDAWTWKHGSDKPAEMGAYAKTPQHESALASGIHEHGFYDATDTMTLERGDVLFAYVWLDPEHVPDTVMLEFNDGSNEHRAFWGRNEIPYGKMNTASQRPMGQLPPAGKWVRLEVPASDVGLEGSTLRGMVFRLHGGRALWDAAGKMNAAAKSLGFFHPPPPVE